MLEGIFQQTAALKEEEEKLILFFDTDEAPSISRTQDGGDNTVATFTSSRILCREVSKGIGEEGCDAISKVTKGPSGNFRKESKAMTSIISKENFTATVAVGDISSSARTVAND